MLGGTNSIGMALNQLFPVGAIYIGTMSVCPLQALGIGSWTLKASDMVLQGAGSVGTVGSTIAAGLPNITGKITPKIHGDIPIGIDASGCFVGSDTGVYSNPNGGSDVSGNRATSANFSAANSNSIYGNSNTVQPPAYVVNIWERTA